MSRKTARRRKRSGRRSAMAPTRAQGTKRVLYGSCSCNHLAGRCGAPPCARSTAPPAPAPVSTDEVFKRFFDGFAEAPLTSAKALTLQILFPTDACYKNERDVGAGASRIFFKDE